MAIEIKVPELPESVSEATVGGWNKQAGEAVSRDENLVDLETDKIMLEVPATAEGVLKEVLKEEGESVQAGDVLAILEEGAAADTGGASDDQPASSSAADSDGDEDEGDDEDAVASPAARKIMAENDIDASAIKGSGKNGRITKGDVKEYLESGTKKDAPAAKTESKPAQASQAAALPDSSPGERVEQRVPMTRIRARIAERLIEAQQNAALLTTFNEVDLHAVMGARSKYKEAFEKTHGAKLGFMSFFVKASVEALKRFPAVNASIDGNDIIYHGYYDIGIAVSSPRGLVVPILRDVQNMGFADVEQQIVDFGMRAKDNKLTMEDLQGGTFSITNGGIFGSMMSTPILNPPQSAILGMHGITERPMVVDGEIKIRPMMYLALTYDHRIIDGREAVQFLKTIKDCLEDPARLLLQV